MSSKCALPDSARLGLTYHTLCWYELLPYIGINPYREPYMEFNVRSHICLYFKTTYIVESNFTVDLTMDLTSDPEHVFADENRGYPSSRPPTLHPGKGLAAFGCRHPHASRVHGRGPLWTT